MKEFKGTPGPWAVSNGYIESMQEIKGDIICESPSKIYMASNKYWPANARLIAAAPEMLEVLQECLLQFEYLNKKFGETGTTNNLKARIEMLIDKAL